MLHYRGIDISNLKLDYLFIRTIPILPPYRDRNANQIFFRDADIEIDDCELEKLVIMQTFSVSFVGDTENIKHIHFKYNKYSSINDYPVGRYQNDLPTTYHSYNSDYNWCKDIFPFEDDENRHTFINTPNFRFPDDDFNVDGVTEKWMKFNRKIGKK